MKAEKVKTVPVTITNSVGIAYVKGNTYDIDEKLAMRFIKEGKAKPNVEDEKEKRG